MLSVLLLKMIEHPKAPPLMEKKKKLVVGKPHRHIATLSQWLKQVWNPGGCMHLSLKHFSSSGPALTCLWESHREPLFQSRTANACEPGLQAKVSPAGTLLVCGFSHLLGVPRGWTHPLAPGDWPEACELESHPALGDCLDPFSPFPTTLLSPPSVNLSLGGRPLFLGVFFFFLLQLFS